jgi:geranylgeranyl reductase family protein
MREFDVVIVGGGPVGGYVAGKIAEKDYNVAIFEKNKQIGLPLNCAGLISRRIFEYLKIPKEDIIQNKIKGANIHSPSGNVLSIGRDKVHGLVIDRVKFDKEIIKDAEKKGANLFLDNKVDSVERKNNFIEFKTSNEEVKSKLIIGADGPNSKIRKQFNLPEPVEFLKGVGAEIKDTNLDPNFVEIFVGKNVAPGFFAWIIPINAKGTKARVGLCVDDSAKHPPKHYLNKFFSEKNSAEFLDGTTITKPIGGIVPIGPLKKTYESNVMLVGDAAAQVKPTSGGGIYPGILCGVICSSVAIQSLNKKDFSEKFLNSYFKLCKKNIGKELNRGMFFRSIYKGLSDKQFEKYIDMFQNKKIKDVINEFGDIDYPSKLAKPLIKNSPLLLKFITKSIVK